MRERQECLARSEKSCRGGERRRRSYWVTITKTTRRRATQCNIASSTLTSLCLKGSTSQTTHRSYSLAERP